MPGCCRRYAAQPEMTETKLGEHLMNGSKRVGMGQGGGGGQGRGRQGQRGPGGPFAVNATGTCFCPKCGNREPHERGVPCLQKQCPKCGTAMTRE
jgi:hypothetical protein